VGCLLLGFFDRFKKKIIGEKNDEKNIGEYADDFRDEVIQNMVRYDESSAKSEFRDKCFLKTLTLFSLSDTSEVMDEVSKGNLIILDITPLQNKGKLAFLELKRSVERLKGFCKSIGGDIAQLGSNYIIVTPNHIKIWRKKG